MQLKKYEIDLSAVTTKEEFHELIRKELPCPGYYGNNLDAFYDVITSQSEGWKIDFVNVFHMEQVLPRYLGALEELCSEAQEDNEYLVINFDLF